MRLPVRNEPRTSTKGSSGTRRRSVPLRTHHPSLPTTLLSVAGLTPQVITETLHCLLVRAEPPVPIREIRVVTTQPGAQRVGESLLEPQRGQFHRFCRDFGIPTGRIRFDLSCILVPSDPGGRPLDDVRTPTDNAIVADTILSLVRDLTKDPAVSLHCSVAGGRKTMGLLLGIAFQLFARPSDRLSHVLVWPPEMEGQRDFFYPPPRPTTYRVNGGTVRSRDIRVELAEIPVLLLRDRVQAAGLDTRPYTALVSQVQRELDRMAAPPPLILDPQSRSLRVEDRAIALTALEFGVYHLLAARRVQGCGEPDCAACSRCSVQAKDFLDVSLHRNICGYLEGAGVRDERTRSLPRWQSSGHERFLQVRSRINRKIHQALGSGRWADQYCIEARRAPRALSRYFIPVDPRQIHVG